MSAAETSPRTPAVLRTLGVAGLALAALVGFIAAAATWPEQLLSPGPVLAAHAEVAGDCFACHSVLTGVDPAACERCHALADIGLKTTKGEPLPDKGLISSFHQRLEVQDCAACHTEHLGAVPETSLVKAFSHDLLKADAQQDCAACHAPPEDDRHADFGDACADCHSATAWTPARFDHQKLPPAEFAQCESCHKAPDDALHGGVTSGCGECHTAEAWKPATFDHDRFFVLDRAHTATCETCHPGGDVQIYTCYGCHEHTERNIAGEHREEGIRDFANCVECHRSGDEHDIRWGGEGGRMPMFRREGGEHGEGGERGERDDDD